MSSLLTAIFILALEYVFIGPDNVELAKLIVMTMCTFLLITVLERKSKDQ